MQVHIKIGHSRMDYRSYLCDYSKGNIRASVTIADESPAMEAARGLEEFAWCQATKSIVPFVLVSFSFQVLAPLDSGVWTPKDPPLAYSAPTSFTFLIHQKLRPPHWSPRFSPSRVTPQSDGTPWLALAPERLPDVSLSSYSYVRHPTSLHFEFHFPASVFTPCL